MIKLYAIDYWRLWELFWTGATSARIWLDWRKSWNSWIWSANAVARTALGNYRRSE